MTVNKALFIVLILVAGAVCWFFLDQIIQFVVENILGVATLGGLGGAEAVRRNRKAAAARAADHIKASDAEVENAVQSLMEADRLADEREDVDNTIPRDDEEFFSDIRDDRRI